MLLFMPIAVLKLLLNNGKPFLALTECFKKLTCPWRRRLEDNGELPLYMPGQTYSLVSALIILFPIGRSLSVKLPVVNVAVSTNRLNRFSARHRERGCNARRCLPSCPTS